MNIADAYAKFLSVERHTTTSIPGRNPTFEMFSDKGRIITSTAFRRLQTKAQVFSLEKNAAVRSRLTHTLEVSLYGQLIAEKILNKIKDDLTEDQRRIFSSAVENACLLHDIGNPPFGHLGEFAIREWFKENKKKIKYIWRENNINKEDIDKYLESFLHFDGNPQGLRIVTKLLLLNSEDGLNLTYTLIASIIKYLDSKPNTDGDFKKKIGFFETERDIIVDVWRKLGLRYDKDNILQRHPLVFIMEAADDIAYSLSDIEDAIEKNIISPSDFFVEIKKYIQYEMNDMRISSSEKYDLMEDILVIIDKHNKKIRFDKKNNDEVKDIVDFVNFKIDVSSYLVDRASEAYVKNHENIINGYFFESLIEYDKVSKILREALKKYSSKNIYTSHEAVNIELSGFKIIQKILNRFKILLNLSKDNFDRCIEGKVKYGEFALEKRLCTLLPKKHLRAYRFACENNKTYEIIYRTHLIIDYLSGMTDSHAVKIFKMISGYSGENTYE